MQRIFLLALAAPLSLPAAEVSELEHYDRDRDGRLTAEEWRDAFVALDTNGDGALALSEISPADPQETLPVAGQPQTAGERRGEEAAGTRQVEAEATRLTATGSEDPLVGEETGRAGERGGREQLHAWDSDGDGALTQAEWSASTIGGDFDALDTDNDDRLDIAEVRAGLRDDE